MRPLLPRGIFVWDAVDRQEYQWTCLNKTSSG